MKKLVQSISDKIFNRQVILKFFVFMVIILFVTLIFDSFIMPLYTKHGKEYELPDVTDKPIVDAIEILKTQGFHPIVKDSVYDEHFAPGTVIQQNPLSYSQVKKGRRVYLVLSIGEKPIYMPKLIGLTPQDAQFRLREENLILNHTVYEFSEFYPRGVVINQSVPVGEMLEKNKKINITVSLGPAPTSLEIPNMVGKSLQTAKKELDVVGVPVGVIKYAYRPKLVPGTVLNQSISAGTNAAKVDSINLLVSTDQPPVDKEKTEKLDEKNMESVDAQ